MTQFYLQLITSELGMAWLVLPAAANKLTCYVSSLYSLILEIKF